jgi:hypothetical protein
VAEAELRAEAGFVSSDGRETVDLLGRHRIGRRTFYLDDIPAIRDALAPFDERVQAKGVDHWSVDRDGNNDVALFAWSSADDPMPQPCLYRYQTHPGVWRAVLAGLGLEDVQ